MKGSNKKNLRNQTVQRKETVVINDNEEVEDDEGEDEEVDAIEAVSSGGIESQEVEGPEPEPKKRKIGRVEGVGSNTRTENMTEFEELGEAMWEAKANRAIIDIEQRTEIQSIKDLLACFDTKEARKKSNNFSNTFNKMRICIQSWVDKKKLIIEAINFIDERGSNESLNTLKVEELIGFFFFFFDK